MNTSYVVQAAGVGELRLAVLTGTGPASYSQVTGDIIYNPGSCQYIEFPSPCTTQSGNYNLSAVPTSAGTLRAGAPSPSQSGWAWLWTYSGRQALTGVTSSGGSGMTAGTYALSFSGGGGTGAAGTVTVTSSAVTSIVITNYGRGYTSAPTVTAATGGTAPTFTATVAPGSGNVPASTNLSAEVVQFGAIVSEL